MLDNAWKIKRMTSYEINLSDSHATKQARFRLLTDDLNEGYEIFHQEIITKPNRNGVIEIIYICILALYGEDE